MREWIRLIEGNQTGVRRATPSDYPEIKACFDRNFPDSGYTSDILDEYLGEHTFVAEAGGRIVGFYVLAPTDPFTDEEIKDDLLPVAKQLQGRRGIEGVALALDPPYRGSGIGKRLIDLPKALSFDFVWGKQLRSLGNLDHWLKRRQLIADGPKMYATAQIFEGEAPKATMRLVDGRMFVLAINGRDVGWFTIDLDRKKDGIVSLHASIDASYRRKGLSSKVYDVLEKHFAEKGLKLVPSTRLSPEAHSFWSKRDASRIADYQRVGDNWYDEETATQVRGYRLKQQINESDKDDWHPGEIAHYEYHCNRSHDSEDAELWYRSHQTCEIIGIDGEGLGATLNDRLDSGEPRTYHVLFPDGFKGCAYEDELFTSPEDFSHDGGPPPEEEIAAARQRQWT